MSGGKRPKSVTFFVDRSLGGHGLLSILRDAGLDIQRHDDHFDQDTPDEDWLEVCGSQGLYVLTADARIRYNPREIAAVREHAVGMFILMGKCPHAVLAKNFISLMPRIEMVIGSHFRPFIAKVYMPAPKATRGRVEVIYPE